MPIDIKFYPQPIASGLAGRVSGGGGGGPISKDQRRTVSGIVFEKYALHLLSKFLEDRGIRVLYNESIIKFLENLGWNVEGWWYILMNNWLLFFSKMPFYELYGYSISDGAFRHTFGRDKPEFWTKKDKDRKTAQWLMKSGNVSAIEVTPLGSLLRKEDFLLVAESENGLLVSPMDAKYRSASHTWLTPQDLRRLHIYFKLLRQALRRRIYPYIIGNRESFSESIWKRDSDGEWVRSNKYRISISKQKDKLFGMVETVRIYAHPKDDPNAEGIHGRFLFSFKYVPIDSLQSALGIDERFIHVIVTPKIVSSAPGVKKIEWEWHAVSEEAYWLPRYRLDKPRWGLDVDAYEVASGHLRSGNYDLFKRLERSLTEEYVTHIHAAPSPSSPARAVEG